MSKDGTVIWKGRGTPLGWRRPQSTRTARAELPGPEGEGEWRGAGEGKGNRAKVGQAAPRGRRGVHARARLGWRPGRIFREGKLTEMEAILHGTVAMANKWGYCGLPVSPLPHLPPLMTAATCCFIVTAGAGSHALVLSSAPEHQALSSPHYFDELFMASTHEDLI